MPGMSGLELLPQARAARPDVPIVMITAYGDAETKRKALDNGTEAILTKPIALRRSAMRSTYGLNAPHERMGCGVTITNGLDRVRPMALAHLGAPAA
jgi:CheY-like chemotaxis protein